MACCMQNVNGRCFSDKIYWQVADQPGKEGPNFLVMVDLVDKEENKGLSSSKGRGREGGVGCEAKQYQLTIIEGKPAAMS